eukprot:m.72510 g.72510  ORF g.72510 m.72510 type:complete len:218 (+) comp7998_c0_seq1:2-655(+)
MAASGWSRIVLAVLALAVVAVALETPPQDYYERLGVERDASAKDIRRAFRRKALLYHPDKNHDKDAEPHFRMIVEAYETLSDPTQRRQYDAGSFSSGGSEFSQTFDFKKFFKDFDASFRRHAEDHMRASGASEEHMREHLRAVYRAQQQAFDFEGLWEDADDSEVGVFSESMDEEETVTVDADGNEVVERRTSEQVCRTITKKQGNSVTTTMECTSL